MPVPVDVAADALYRCAAEAVRQHERVARLNERGVHHTELSEASALRDLSHQHLRARGDLYEMAAAAGRGGHDEAYWHAANGMWHAAREYCRRNADCDVATFKPGTVTGAILNDMGAQLEPEGLERIYAVMRSPPSYAGWDEAADMLKRANADLFPNVPDARWREFSRALYVEREGRVTGDYDPNFPQAILEGRGTNPRDDKGAADDGLFARDSEGKPLAAGSPRRNPAFAKTLRQIAETGPEATIEALMSAVAYFRLPLARAKAILRRTPADLERLTGAPGGAGSAVTTMRISNDGVAWTERPFATSVAWIFIGANAGALTNARTAPPASRANRGRRRGPAGRRNGSQ